MEETTTQTAEQMAAFQRIWAESLSKTMQAAFTVSPNSPPPEMLRQMRNGILAALADSWEEFMRSPQFLEGMKQWMEQAVTFRKMSNDFMARVRNEAQSPSREDIDTVMLTVRHMETRLLTQMQEISEQVSQLNARLAGEKSAAPAPAPAPGQRAARKAPGKRGKRA